MAEIDETLTKIVDLSSISSEDQYCYERTTRHIQRAAERPAIRKKTTPPPTGCGEAQRLLLRGDRIIGRLQRDVLNVEELSQELRCHLGRPLDRFLICPLIHPTLITVMKITTQQYLRDFFWDIMYPRHKPKKGYKQNDYCADIRVAWTDFVDAMSKDGRISDKLADRATL